RVHAPRGRAGGERGAPSDHARLRLATGPRPGGDGRRSHRADRQPPRRGDGDPDVRALAGPPGRHARRAVAPATRLDAVMAERTLTERELTGALLARQLLLGGEELPLARAIERVGGLQTQYAPSGYISLWSRLSRVARDELTRALERRQVVQGTL